MLRGKGRTHEDHAGSAGHPRRRCERDRGFYHERLGFTPAEAAAPRPEGGSRQACRKTIAYTHAGQKTQYDGEFAQDAPKLNYCPLCLHGTPSADDLVLYVEAGGCRRPYGSMKVNLGGVHGIRTDR